MPLPRAVARFNKRVTNRFLEPVARRSTGFAVVHHSGRRSGTAFRTPVNLFARSDGRFIVALTYGPAADWVQNVLDDGGKVETRSGERPIETAIVVGRSDAWPVLPGLVRIALRAMRVRDFLLLSISSEGPVGRGVVGRR